MAADQLKVGTWVKLKGLQNKPENNGRVCTIVQFVESKGRYEVETPSGAKFKIKRENFEVCPPEPVAPPTAKKKSATTKVVETKATDEEATKAKEEKKSKKRKAEEQPEAEKDAKRKAEAPATVSATAKALLIHEKARSRSRSPRRDQKAAETAKSRMESKSGNDSIQAPARPHGESIQLSKALSNVLRHTAQSLGVLVRPDGFCKVAEIIALQQFLWFKCTEADIRKMAKENDKGRFEICEEHGDVLVRAVQGHSMKVVQDDQLLQKLSADDSNLPAICVHGTYRRFYDDILKDGLRAGGKKKGNSKRNHVHFAPYEPGDGRVISGMRYDCELAIYLDLRAALREGVPFFRSVNEVILSPGSDGIVPAKFITKVKDVKTGEWLKGKPT